jgi:hypothetical protein
MSTHTTFVGASLVAALFVGDGLFREPPMPGEKLH